MSDGSIFKPGISNYSVSVSSIDSEEYVIEVSGAKFTDDSSKVSTASNTGT